MSSHTTRAHRRCFRLLIERSDHVLEAQFSRRHTVEHRHCVEEVSGLCDSWHILKRDPDMLVNLTRALLDGGKEDYGDGSRARWPPLSMPGHSIAWAL